jgi:hypothetical protein
MRQDAQAILELNPAADCVQEILILTGFFAIQSISYECHRNKNTFCPNFNGYAQ